MTNISIDGAMLRDMFLSGAALLEQNKKLVDSLNVFPVPDGDTGTNMSMTMQGAVKELRTMPQSVSVDAVIGAVASGSLRSARGNSGVILSQLFRGIAKVLKGKPEVNAKLFAQALMEGKNAAYKAVMKPKEGTILTVSGAIADAAVAAVSNAEPDMLTLLRVVLDEGEKSLANTPNLLPVLKEAGVVDSGGKGLMLVYHGFFAALNGEEIEDYFVPEEAKPVEATNTSFDVESFSTDTIEFGYCTEFFIVRLHEGFDEEQLEKFREHLMRIGDSVVVAADSDCVKVHVHSNCPGKILQIAMRFGELDRLKIENMREQNRQLMETRRQNQKDFGLIAVSCGEGLDALFTDLKVDRLISGGQTMNPSIDTIVNTVRQVNARSVFVLPNNGNIILAAQQAVELCDSRVIVLPTKTIPQGIAAALAFNPDQSVEENEHDMNAAIGEVVSGSVTYAVRETQFEGKHIEEGDIIGMIDGKLSVVAGSVDEASLALIEKMMPLKDDDSMITLYYGEGMDEENANALAERIGERFPDADVGVQFGGQPLYYYFFSVE